MDSNNSSPRSRFAFISSNAAWGGSEELWSATAAALAEQGHAVTVFKDGLDEAEPRIHRLRQLDCNLRDLTRYPLFPRAIRSLMTLVPYRISHGLQLARLRTGLSLSKRPHLVVISQGGNSDGLYLADVCRRMKLPYALFIQKASDLYWPTDSRRKRLRAVYSEAVALFFVSEHNRRLTEEQLGLDLPHGTVVRNPFLVPWQPRHDWPHERAGIRLACIGRLYPMEKGQDLLLRVIARDKWRQRPVSVTFYGSGHQSAGLEGMAQYLKLTSVSFGGFVRDVAAIWNDHHGLILPTRCEGLPLVLVEAMLSGRVSIVTNAGGNAEVVEDEVTGFLANAATEDALDEAMERAWSRRDEWQAIGEAAATKIRTLVPPDPAGVMAATLVSIARETREAPSSANG